MAKSPGNSSSVTELLDALSRLGLVCFGGLEIGKDECAKGQETLIGSKALLIGNGGSGMWSVFSHSDEYRDELRDPMNRWTRRNLDRIAVLLGARAVYPFDEPYWPFQRIAQKAAGVKSSPLGILIHPEYGLWHAFRGLLVFENPQDYASQISAISAQDEDLIHPCDTCVEKPCLTACPVEAFTGEQLLVDRCFAHLDGGEDPQCSSIGCQARLACPVGSEHQYDVTQMQFHMKYYRG